MRLAHDDIAALGWPELYLQGRLDEQQREAFEQHYLYCARCVELLETDTALRETLRVAGARDALTGTPPLAPIAWLSARSRGVQQSLLAAVLVAAGAAHVWQWQHGRQLERALREALARPTPQAQAAAGGAMPSQPTPSRPAASSMPGSWSAPPTPAPDPGAARVESEPRTRVPQLVFARLRGEPGTAVPELAVRLSRRDAGALLVFPEGLACLPRCSAHIVPRRAGRATLGPYDVLRGADERGRVFVPADLLLPGIYDVRVGAAQAEADAESFAFEVMPPAAR